MLKKSKGDVPASHPPVSAAASPLVPGTLVIHLCSDLDTDQRYITIHGEKKYIAENICIEAAKHLGIGSIAFPLFSLRHATKDFWLAPNDVVTLDPQGPAIEYVFRIRFIPPDSKIRNQLLQIDPKAFHYLFLQIRDDFINSNVKYRDKSKGMGQDHELGMGVIDMVRYGLERGMSRAQLNTLEPQAFIPTSTKNGSFKRFWDPFRLKKNFAPYVDKQFDKYSEHGKNSSGDSRQPNGATLIKLTYVIGVLEYADDYGSEVFNGWEEILLPPRPASMGADSGRATDLVRVEIDVHPNHPSSPGIHVRSKQNEFHCLIEELDGVDMARTENTIRVTIKRNNGCPYVIQFKSEEEAKSFVSFLDGYYRLRVDYYQTLCDSVASPLFAKIKSLRCHGPISLNRALESMRRKQKDEPAYNYLLKLSLTSIGKLVLVCCRPELMSRENYPYEIDINEDINFTEDKTSKFSVYWLATDPSVRQEKLLDLIEHYRKNDIICNEQALRLGKHVVPYSTTDNSKLYLCRDESGEEESTSREKEGVKYSSDQPMLIPSVKTLRLIGESCLTKVFSGAPDRSLSSKNIAVKQLSPEQAHLQQFFTDGMSRSLFWNCGTLVPVFAVCLSSPLSFVMEEAPKGSLADYLEQPEFDLKNYHLVVAAEQIAQALLYLEEKDFVHGNICCRNVLLYNTSPSEFKVKLSDPGMVYLYNALPLEHDLNFSRLPYIAPECYNNLSRMTHETDRYAYGTTLYEMFNVGGPFHQNTMTTAEICQFVRSGKVLAQPETCPVKVYELIIGCWELRAEYRTSPKDVVRELRQLQTSVDIYNHYQSAVLPVDSQTSGEGTITGSSAQSSRTLESISSSVAAADNDINKRRLQQTLLHANQRNSVAQRSSRSSLASVNISFHSQPHTHQQTSPSGDSLFNDSRSPLISGSHHNGSHSFETVSLPRGTGDRREPLTREVDNQNSADSQAALLQNMQMMGRSTPQSIPSHSLFSSPVQSGSSSQFIIKDFPNLNLQNRPLPATPNIRSLYNVEIDTSKKLGQGHYGEVYKGVYRDSNGRQDVAIKCLKLNASRKFADELEKEMHIMVKLEHQHIVRIIGQYELKTSKTRGTVHSLVMEFVEHGCLRDFLKKRESEHTEPQSTKDLIRFGREIAEGMCYLSSKKIVHRDLAARNVLVTVDYHMKISDFGLSRCLSNETDYYKSEGTKDFPAPWTLSSMHPLIAPKGALEVLRSTVHQWATFSNIITRIHRRSAAGSTAGSTAGSGAGAVTAGSTAGSPAGSAIETQVIINRCAPEALSHKKFHEKGDVWSFGVTLWEVFSYGKMPLLCEEVRKQLQELMKGKRLARPELCPEPVYQLMSDHCWKFEASERFTFEEVLKVITDIEDSFSVSSS